MNVKFIVFSKEFLPLFIFIFIINFFSSLILTRFSLFLAKKYKILDSKESNPNRKTQKKPVPLLGATGFIFSSSFWMVLIWLVAKNKLPFLDFSEIEVFSNLDLFLLKNLDVFKLFWIFISILILFLAGFLDDKFKFSSKIMILPILTAVLTTVFLGGVSISTLSYSFIWLLPSNLFLQDLLAVIWLILCISATKFLDGLDGLVSSLGIIALLTIATVASFANVDQPFIVFLAILWAVGILGFLPYNYPDAKIYLGEGGSLIIGFLIGVLSILSGAKIATSSAVIGWFVYDILFVMSLRILRKKNPLEGDRLHWHFRLQDLGLKKWQVLWLTNFLVFISALLGIFLPTHLKLYFLIFQGVFLIFIFTLTELLSKRNKIKG
jgi:UDP-GlcNAc:undecaprenyl-phosphate GlcNAc-1-phosphate transferase